MLNIITIDNADKRYHEQTEAYMAENPQDDFCFIVNFKEDCYTYGYMGLDGLDETSLDLPAHRCNRHGCPIYVGRQTLNVGISIARWPHLPGIIAKDISGFYAGFLRDQFGVRMDKPKIKIPLSIKGRGIAYVDYSKSTATNRPIVEIMLSVTKEAKAKNLKVKSHVVSPTSLEDEGITISREELVDLFCNYAKRYF